MVSVLMGHHAYGRQLARTYEPRSPQAGISSTSSTLAASAPSGDPTITRHDVLTNLPRTVKVLGGVITVLGVIILVFVAYKIKTWRDRRRALARSSSGSVAGRNSYGEEKGKHGGDDLRSPSQAVLVPTTPAPDADWTQKMKFFHVPVPQLFNLVQKFKRTSASSNHDPLLPNKSPSHARSRSFESITSFTSPTGMSQESVVSPRIVVESPVPPLPSHTQTSSVAKTLRASQTGKGGNKRARPRKQGPRLMIVWYPFEPTRPDEIGINVDETVRVYEEYRDGWCFIEHINCTVARKGFVPRCCLEEPSKPTIPRYL